MSNTGGSGERSDRAALTELESAVGGLLDRLADVSTRAEEAEGKSEELEELVKRFTGDDAEAVAVASDLIREVGYEPVLIGGLAMGKYLMPGTPLAGERSADEIREIAAGLE